MKRAMKYVALASMLLMALGWGKQAMAASTGTVISLLVTPQCTRGVQIVADNLGTGASYSSGTANASFNFGSQAFSPSSASSTTAVSSSFTVTNVGTCGDTWTLQITSNPITGGQATAWGSTDAGNIGTDTYALYAVFSSSVAAPVFGNFGGVANIVKQASAVTCSGTTKFFVGGGTGQNCSAVTPSASEQLYFGLAMPTGETDPGSVTQQRTIGVTLTTAN